MINGTVSYCKKTFPAGYNCCFRMEGDFSDNKLGVFNHRWPNTIFRYLNLSFL